MSSRQVLTPPVESEFPATDSRVLESKAMSLLITKESVVCTLRQPEFSQVWIYCSLATKNSENQYITVVQKEV
jgi:hypothetical protein